LKAEGIKEVEVREVEGCAEGYGGAVNGGLGLFDVCEEGGGEEFLVFVEPD